MLDSKFTQQQMVVNKFADPSIDYNMTVRDYIVRAFASAPITITLPAIAASAGRTYSISAGLASDVNTVTITNRSDSDSWSDIVFTSTGSHTLFYSDGLKWHNISNIIVLTGNITGTEDEAGVINTTITDKAVIYAKIQDVAIDSILGQTGIAGTVIEIPCTAAGRAILDDVDNVAQRVTLGLVIGTDVEAYDATLESLAGLGTAADKFAYTTGIDTWIEGAITAAGRAILDDIDNTAQRVTLGLVIGTNVQAYDATLASLADLGTVADVMTYTTGIDTWAETAITTAGRALLDDADNVAQLATLGLTATAAEINNVADVSTRMQSLIASGAITPGIQSVELDNITTVIAATIADASTHQGLFIVKDTSASGTLAHTLTLTIGTFDGTATIATFNAPNDAITVYFDSVGNGTVLALTGTAALT